MASVRLLNRVALRSIIQRVSISADFTCEITVLPQGSATTNQIRSAFGKSTLDKCICMTYT